MHTEHPDSAQEPNDNLKAEDDFVFDNIQISNVADAE